MAIAIALGQPAEARRLASVDRVCRRPEPVAAPGLDLADHQRVLVQRDDVDLALREADVLIYDGVAQPLQAPPRERFPELAELAVQR